MPPYAASVVVRRITKKENRTAVCDSLFTSTSPALCGANWLPELVSDRTVMHNDPNFRSIALTGGWRPEGTPAYPAVN